MFKSTSAIVELMLDISLASKTGPLKKAAKTSQS
jgi:hypothetical protein